MLPRAGWKKWQEQEVFEFSETVLSLSLSAIGFNTALALTPDSGPSYFQ